MNNKHTKIARRKERRKFAKWLLKNNLIGSWYAIKRLHKDVQKNLYYPYFVGCRFFKHGECILNDPHLTWHRCICPVYMLYPQKPKGSGQY